MKLDRQQILTLLRNEASRLSTACCLAEYGFAGHRASIDACASRIAELTALLGTLETSTEPSPATSDDQPTEIAS